MTPTQRSLKKLKDDGYHVQVVEKWNPFAHIRQDLFGGIDILGVKADEKGVFGVQATSIDNVSSRVKKVMGLPAIRSFILAGNKFCVWGWGKRGKRGERKTWELKEIHIKEVDFEGI